MHFHKLTNAQLYAIARDKAHLKMLRQGANDELLQRNLTEAERLELSSRYYKSDELAGKPLPVAARIGIMIFPFPWFYLMVLHCIVASRLIETGRVRMWKQYWLCIAGGLVFWTVVVFIVALFMR